MEKITALILAKNEEQNIEDCIKTVLFCDEVLVIDDFSTDRTKEIAERLGAKVLQRSMNGDWGGQQTFAIRSAAHPWVLFVDADERISEALAEEIKATVAKGNQNAYWIKRRNRFHFNKATHGILHPDWVNRLFPAAGSYVEGFVHPKIKAPYPNKKLKSPMYHYTYDNWEQYLGKLTNIRRWRRKPIKKRGNAVTFSWISSCAPPGPLSKSIL